MNFNELIFIHAHIYHVQLDLRSFTSSIKQLYYTDVFIQHGTATLLNVAMHNCHIRSSDPPSKCPPLHLTFLHNRFADVLATSHVHSTLQYLSFDPLTSRNLGFSSMRIVSCRPGIICSQDLEWSHNVWKWSLQNVHSHDPMVRKPSQYKEFYNAQEMCLWDPATPHIKDDSVVN